MGSLRNGVSEDTGSEGQTGSNSQKPEAAQLPEDTAGTALVSDTRR